MNFYCFLLYVPHSTQQNLSLSTSKVVGREIQVIFFLEVVSVGHPVIYISRSLMKVPTMLPLEVHSLYPHPFLSWVDTEKYHSGELKSWGQIRQENHLDDKTSSKTPSKKSQNLEGKKKALSKLKRKIHQFVR